MLGTWIKEQLSVERETETTIVCGQCPILIRSIEICGKMEEIILLIPIYYNKLVCQEILNHRAGGEK